MGKNQSPKHPESTPELEEPVPHTTQGWFARQRRRWKSLLDWLAKGAGHACPT